jgi:SAM-dependent methyltransferase
MSDEPKDKQHSWDDYYKQTGKNPPSKLVVRAMDFVERKGVALELGAGTTKDAEFLLGQGFEVLAVDCTEASQEIFAQLVSKNAHCNFQLARFEDFNFERETYDLISAQRALPFIEHKEILIDVFSRIVTSLKPGGVFVGNFFGPRDTWCLEGKKMSFVSELEIREMLAGLDIKVFSERENDEPTAAGTPHHWHIFNVIAVKE